MFKIFILFLALITLNYGLSHLPGLLQISFVKFIDFKNSVE